MISGFFDDHAQFVYNKALTFQYEHVVSEDDIRLALATISYNIAQCFHRRSQKEGEKSVLQTLSFYNYCLSYLESSSKGMGCSNLIITSLNNIAQVYLDLCNFDMAHKVTDALIAVVSRMMALSYPVSFSEDEMPCIHLNALTAQRYGSAPVA